MRRALPVFAAVFAATWIGTMAEGILAKPILSVLSFDPRAEAVVHLFGKLVSALAAIIAYAYYFSRLSRQ